MHGVHLQTSSSRWPFWVVLDQHDTNIEKHRITLRQRQMRSSFHKPLREDAKWILKSFSVATCASTYGEMTEKRPFWAVLDQPSMTSGKVGITLRQREMRSSFHKPLGEDAKWIVKSFSVATCASTYGETIKKTAILGCFGPTLHDQWKTWNNSTTKGDATFIPQTTWKGCQMDCKKLLSCNLCEYLRRND